MQRFLIAAAIAATTLAAPAFAADIGVSVTIGQPGFYGRIDIGDYPYPVPRVIYRQPRIIERIVIERDPIYLRVPPGHRKHWRKYCHQYGACGERVYFVRDDWYLHEFAPHYRERHHRNDRYDDRNHGRKHGDRDRHDHDHGKDRGRDR